MIKQMKLSNIFLNLFLTDQYRIDSEISMEGSDCIFDCIYFLDQKCHKINVNRSESYKDSRD